MKPGHKYQPEIDGLRAVAVISVVLFHLDLHAFQGGFVGVDIFFVISGYLITGFVRRDLAGAGFRYRQFFVRRVRRLAPALLFVTIATCLVAYLLLLPRDLYSFAKSVIAQPIALQNIHFLAEGEYFQGSGKKPLLHTWSLGVEEQFYLVWPFVILFVSRFRRTWAVAILGVVLIVSFCISLALPILSPKTSFFLFPARAWELGIGGVLAILEEGRRGSGEISDWRRTGLAAASLMLLLISFVWISEDMLFPGWVALIPVVATTALVASFASGGSSIKRVLSMRPLVFIGLISYSLYLWHWPVIVFARHLGFDPASLATATAITALSLLLAVFSYQYVEQPIRKRRVLAGTRTLIATATGLGCLLIAAGTIALATDGLAFRFDQPARSMLVASFDAEGGTRRCGFVFRALHPTAQVCQFNRVPASNGRGVLLWGNSHGAMWVGLLAEMGDTFDRPVYLNARNCRATSDHAFCNEAVQDGVIASIESNGVSDVVLASSWFGEYGIPDRDFEEKLEALVRKLSAHSVEIWLVVDVPTDSSFDPESRYELNPDSPTFGSIALTQHQLEKQSRELALFHRLASTILRVHIIDPTDDYCFDGERCYGGHDERVWYRDARHITDTGAREARHRFLPVFAEARD